MIVDAHTLANFEFIPEPQFVQKLLKMVTNFDFFGSFNVNSGARIVDTSSEKRSSITINVSRKAMNIFVN